VNQQVKLWLTHSETAVEPVAKSHCTKKTHPPNPEHQQFWQLTRALLTDQMPDVTLAQCILHMQECIRMMFSLTDHFSSFAK